MRKDLLIVLFSTILFLANCSDNPTESEDNGFSFNVTVTDGNSLPLRSVTISAWNKFVTDDIHFSKLNSIENIEATTSIQFALKQNCLVNLYIFDLGNIIIEKLIDNESKVAGYHKINYVNSEDIGSGVFKCKLVVMADSISNPIIFSDSIYSVIISPDPEHSVIGQTDENGKYSSSNRILFPNLFKLPSLIRTNSESPNLIATFSISDEVIIALTDNNDQIRYFESSILDTENTIKLNWDDGSVEYPDWRSNKPIILNKLSKTLGDSVGIVPNIFKLYQNYPNPFN